MDRGFIFIKGEEMQFHLPSRWEIICQATPRKTSKSNNNTKESMKESLENPIGTRRIRDLGNRSSKVAIMVDDDMRPTPVKELLPMVLGELHPCGVTNENI